MQGTMWKQTGDKGRLKRLLLILFIANVIINAIPAQLLTHDGHYRQVFVETDDFGSEYLEELDQILKLQLRDSVRLLVMNDLAYYWHTRNLDSALVLTLSGLDLAAQFESVIGEGRFQITQGAILLRAEQLIEAESVLLDAENKVSEADLPFLYTQMGYVRERQGLLGKAADYAEKSLSLAKKLADLKAEALALSDLSNLFWKQGKYAIALQYGLESEKVFKQRGIDDLDYDFTLYVIGNIYLALDRYEEALQYFHRSLKMGEQYGFYNNLSDTYISLIDLYTEIREYDKALFASNEAIRYAKLLNNNFLLMRAWLSIGRLQNLQADYREAVSSLNRCLVIATPEFGDEFFLHQVYKELATAHARLGNFEDAFRAFSRYDETKDSVFTAEADRRISQLQTEYEVAAKEATISAQESELLQREKLQFLTAGFLLFLAVISVVLYRNYSQKRRLNDRLTTLNKDLTIKNVELDQRNAENELLLKEIHHRVKNNLEVVSSLLELQSAQIDDPNVQNAMQESQSRVQSMGIIHQKLYQGKNLASIEMKDYFVNLGEGVLDSFAMDQHVTVNVEMDPIELDVDTAVPIGLIVNELLTNAMKYAFPDKSEGSVKISLRQEEDRIDLLVSDNGVGKNQNADGRKGFGTLLIELLTRQLDGSMVEQNGTGTSVRFEFKKSKRL